MDINSPTNLLLVPAVVAAVISGLVAVIGFFISARTVRRTHTEKLTLDRELADRKANADIGLAEKKFTFDLELADRKANADIAIAEKKAKFDRELTEHKASADHALAEKKLAFDREQAERKVNADITMAEKKLALDQALADWKRRTELAEQVLTDFYRARDLFATARTPISSEHEGASRQREEDESESDTSYRNSIYTAYERLSKHTQLFSDLHARRYRFMALFGAEAALPFDLLAKAINQVAVATRALLRDHADGQSLSDKRREKYETIIGWTTDDEDPIPPMLNEAVAQIESFCQPVLQAKPV